MMIHFGFANKGAHQIGALRCLLLALFYQEIVSVCFYSEQNWGSCRNL